MARSGFKVLAAAVLVMAVTFQEASAIRCWRCSSDASNSAFCDDPFDSSLISQQQKRWSFVECSHPPSTDQRPVCKKVKQLVEDKLIVSRSCYWENIDAPKDECLNINTPSYIKNVFCETCTNDKCNGAAQYGPIALLVAIPAIIAKILIL